MSAATSANIVSIQSRRRALQEAFVRDEAGQPLATMWSSDPRKSLNRASHLLEEIRQVLDPKETYVLQTLLDLVAVEIHLLRKEQSGKYCHSENDIKKAFSSLQAQT